MSVRIMCRATSITIAALLAALALSLNCEPALADNPVIYVDADATTGGDGQSWSTAYRYLQDALDEANSGGGSYEIWVAEGVYYPDEDSDGDHVAGAATE
ncbi:MAG: hypothetical protein PVI07_19700, partial [Anaerolineae bacterium]